MYTHGFNPSKAIPAAHPIILCSQIPKLKNLFNKFKAFNWDCQDVKDGHSFKELINSLKKKNKKNKPMVIILNTIKGKGIKEFENDPAWHARKIQGKELEIGKRKLGIV